MRRALSIAAAFMLAMALVSVPGDVSAQERSGFWFNGGLGWGSLGCDGCSGRESSVVATLGVGGTLSQQATLGASINGWSKEVSGTRLTASTLAATLRFYPSATGGFFLLGGLGYGVLELEVSGTGTASETGPAAVLGLGFDVRVSDSVSLTPFLNGVGISFEGGNVNFNQLGLSITAH